MGGIKSLLLLLWAGVTVSTVVDLQKRIIGGQPCASTDRLYHVQITDANNNFICGGSLISDKWILTAAHCETTGMRVVLRVHPGPGTSEAISTPPVKFGYVAPKINDIMLLRLPRPVRNIRPVRLPNCGPRDPRPNIVQMAGHAATGPSPGMQKVNAQSKTLYCANIRIANCLTPRQNTFCGQSNTVDTCPGDSGGGAVFNDMIYGVISTSGQRICERPVRFTDVCPFKSQIQRATGIP